MRMRFKPYAGPELAACPFHMNDATRYKGRWRETFARPGQPLHLELGCGKGRFTAETAAQTRSMAITMASGTRSTAI